MFRQGEMRRIEYECTDIDTYT